MPTQSPAEVSPDYGHSLQEPKDFQREHPHLYRNGGQLRWVLRDRRQNGLMAYGAVVEVYGTNSERPRLYIHKPSWFRWMQAGGSRAPKPQT